MQDIPQKPVLVILGPTATGKSDLAVHLAQKFNGEVISADSRQVYTGLDIGTGKITREEMQGVPHHLLDVVNPNDRFTVTQFIKLAEKAISDIQSRGKLPIICGGTGFYIESLINNSKFPEVPANEELREKLSTKTAEELLEMLQKSDPARAKTISENESDRHNKRRIIRAIEISKVSPLEERPWSATSSTYYPLFIGLNLPIDQLRTKIHDRLLKRLEAGMLEEVRSLHEKGLSWERMEELGLEYRFLARFLQGKIPKGEMIRILTTEIGQYAKRQMTWFKRDNRITWFDPKDTQKIEAFVQEKFGK